MSNFEKRADDAADDRSSAIPQLNVFVCTPESEVKDEIGETNRLLSEICADFDSEPFPVLLAGLILLKYGGKIALLTLRGQGPNHE